MAETYRDIKREAENDARQAKGKKADTDAGFESSQDKQRDKLRAFAAKSGGGDTDKPVQRAGEDLGSFAARTSEWRRKKQDTQSSAIKAMR